MYNTGENTNSFTSVYKIHPEEPCYIVNAKRLVVLDSGLTPTYLHLSHSNRHFNRGDYEPTKPYTYFLHLYHLMESKNIVFRYTYSFVILIRYTCKQLMLLRLRSLIGSSVFFRSLKTFLSVQCLYFSPTSSLFLYMLGYLIIFSSFYFSYRFYPFEYKI